MNALIFATMALLVATERPDLVGRVVTEGDKPVAGATVFMYTAGARVGINPFCPSCYPDCGKSATTASDGAFLIRSLDPDLIFRVLVVGEGLDPAFVASVDPIKGPITAELRPLDPKRREAKHYVRGRILDPSGTPVVGAEVSPESFKTEAHWGFTPGIVDPLSVTNLHGEFLLTSKSPAVYFTLKVKGRGLAPKLFAKLPPGEPGQTLTLGRGASVAGRLLREGRPVKGAAVGLVRANLTINETKIITHDEIGTDNEGRFLFSNVPPDDTYQVFGLMNKDYGAAPVKRVSVGSDDSVQEVGVLEFQAGHRLAGRVILSDGTTIPPHVRLSVGRDKAWDSQMVELDEQGRFEFHGLPTEGFTLSTIVRGYHLSPRNACASPLNPGNLQGIVDRDIDNLTILLEPGAGPRFNYEEYNTPEFRQKLAEFEARKKQTIRGIDPTALVAGAAQALKPDPQPAKATGTRP